LSFVTIGSSISVLTEMPVYLVIIPSMCLRPVPVCARAAKIAAIGQFGSPPCWTSSMAGVPLESFQSTLRTRIFVLLDHGGGILSVLMPCAVAFRDRSTVRNPSGPGSRAPRVALVVPIGPGMRAPPRYRRVMASS
jgi:hypothetical protein